MGISLITLGRGVLLVKTAVLSVEWLGINALWIWTCAAGDIYVCLMCVLGYYFTSLGNYLSCQPQCFTCDSPLSPVVSQQVSSCFPIALATA